MKRSFFVVAVALLLALFTGCVGTSNATGGDATTVEPGYWKSDAKPELAKVIELRDSMGIGEDEFVVFYVRPDKDYEPWALWIWAVKDGDGSKAWDYSQKFEVKDGIAYMRFKKDGSTTGGTTFIDADGKTGLIVRKDSGWDKDCADDRIWDQSVSNTCVIFSGDQQTYNVGEYKPRFVAARLESEDTIVARLSDGYGLDLKPGTSNFVVTEPKTGKTYEIKDVVNADRTRENNFATRIRVTLAENVNVNYPIEISHPVFESAFQVDTSEFAWKAAEKTIPGSDVKLGCTYDASTNKASFVLWAPTSSDVVLNLYNKDGLKEPTKTVAMTFDAATGVWTANTTDNINGWFYDYSVTNSRGTNKALDPYAKSMAAYRNEGGSGRAAVVDINSAKAGKMSKDYVKLAQREDAVIYEVSVRDFTISPDSGVKNAKGSYKAFIEKLPYLKELGVTHLQIMPVLNFYYTDETNKKYEGNGTANNNNYNWGYDPHNYFTPEGWYSSDPTNPYSRVSELRELVDAAHSYGLGVLLDVVYNHMANTALMEDIVPGYYFRTANGKFTSKSGCGNDVASTRAMVRRLIVESTSYWVKEYKVDGFRFDLMGLIDTETMFKAYEECAKINKDTLFVGEGWSMYNGPSGTFGMEQKQVSKTDSISVFNDELRDAVKAGGFNEGGKGFITGKVTAPSYLVSNILGIPKRNYKADDPGDSVQYLVCHDGLTLHDNIFNNTPLNESIPAEKAEGIKRIKMGNFITTTVQGVAFFHAGQERGRSKPKLNATTELTGNFVRNSYDASDNINQIVWKLDSDYQGLLDYTKGLIEMRKNTSAFRLGTREAVEANSVILEEATAGLDNVIAYSVKADGYTYYVVMNGTKDSATVNVGASMANAEVLADSVKAGSKAIASPKGVKADGTSITVDGLTCTVVRVK